MIDEDTSATNFMVRDDFMQQVISREKEPITPFLERARDLYEKAGISTILVAGSSGAFFYIADTILQMDCYRALDITESVKTPVSYTHLRAPGPPAAMAEATPTILPVPMVAESAVHRAPKEVTSPWPSSSFLTMKRRALPR